MRWLRRIDLRSDLVGLLGMDAGEGFRKLVS